MNNAWQHFKTITHHRHLVMKGCFHAGLYKQGLLHDLSKYSPIEFLVGVKYYQGDQSPNNKERKERGYSSAWLHHKGRNLHHLEYWIDYSMSEQSPICGMKMPIEYVVEMFIDRVSACKNYQKDAYTKESPLKYYEKGEAHYMLHPKTRMQLEFMLRMLADRGERYTYAYIRKYILHNDDTLLRRLEKWERNCDFLVACRRLGH